MGIFTHTFRHKTGILGLPSNDRMKKTVIVKLKEGVLDPQGETIRRALNKLGHPVQSVCQGKYFELEFEGNSGNRSTLEIIARDVLSNPIIEDFYIQDGNLGTDPELKGSVPKFPVPRIPKADK